MSKIRAGKYLIMNWEAGPLLVTYIEVQIDNNGTRSKYISGRRKDSLSRRAPADQRRCTQGFALSPALEVQ